MFPALEKRRTFGAADLTYLANLCHNCGECLYACQFAPPHEFGINVPSLLADVRTRSYEAHAWPPVLGRAFRRNGFRTGLAALALVFSALLLATLANGQAIVSSDGSADFYGVIPHGVMVTTFGAVSIFVLVALAISGVRFWRDAAPGRSRSRHRRWPSRARRADASSPARQRQRLHVEPGSAHAVAAVVSSLHVLRLRVVLRVHDGRGDSITACSAGTLRTRTRAFRCCSVRRVDSGCSSGHWGWLRCDRRATRRLARRRRAWTRQPVPRAALPHEPDGSRAARPPSQPGDGDPARRAPCRGAGASPDAALRQVRARTLSTACSDSVSPRRRR